MMTVPLLVTVVETDILTTMPIMMEILLFAATVMRMNITAVRDATVSFA